ncbi:hypothetical protein D1646_15795 [Pseudoflavonifractor sp. 60]|nr:hypothetical protein [Pseudoflavonifractor sp. 60]
METLDLPKGLTTIGQDACSACEQLREVRLPSTPKEIGRYTFHAPAGSYAERYARENDIKFQPL